MFVLSWFLAVVVKRRDVVLGTFLVGVLKTIFLTNSHFLALPKFLCPSKI